MSPILDLERIRTFLTVISHGSFKSAAKQLNKTPSALTMQLQKLEEQLGHQLMKRSNRGIELTEAGRILTKHGEMLIRANNILISELRSDELSGVFTFGSPSDYGPTLLQKLLPIIRLEFPKIIPRVILEPSRILRQRVKTGEIDIAIVARENGSDEGNLLWQEELNWFGSTNHEGDTLPISLLSSDCVLRDITLNALSSSKLNYQIVLESSSITSLKDAVDTSFSVALLPQSLALQLNEKRKSSILGLPKVSPIEFAIITSSGLDERSKEKLQQRLEKTLYGTYE